MNVEELCYLSAGQLGQRIQSRELSPVEIVKAHLERIQSLEPRLNSFITLLSDPALAAAKEAEKEVQSNRYRGPLHGVPLGLKDLYYTRGIRTTSGTRVLEDVIPDFDGTVTSKLKEAGTILLGKLNLHPLAYGPTGENPDYGDMHNPWNTERITGGSSGGCGSAAASGQCTLTMGTDTGGSVRIPASLCGLVGLKPTYGRVSRYGLTTLAWSQDHCGPMVRTVEDGALVLNGIAGLDPYDPTSADVPVPDYSKALTGDIRGVRVGVPKEYFEVPIDLQVKEAVLKAIERLGELGAVVSEVSWPLFHDCMPIASTIQMSEAAACHSQLIREHGRRLWSPVRLRLEAGFFILATDFLQAQRARTLFCRQSLDLLRDIDLLAGPTLPVTAFRIGTSKITLGGKEVGVIALLTQYTRPFNLNGFPAITVPCGFSEEGLPIGLQLAGRPFDEETVLRAAYAYEQSTDWHLRRPPI